MSIKEIKDMPLDFRIHLHKELLHFGILQSCLNCEHSSTDGVLTINSEPQPVRPTDVRCKLYNAPPPLQVIVVGCSGWVQGIPF